MHAAREAHKSKGKTLVLADTKLHFYFELRKRLIAFLTYNNKTCANFLTFVTSALQFYKERCNFAEQVRQLAAHGKPLKKHIS